ncbi:cytochrome P450 3A6 [Parasteatoda tepidariorum]|uniref:cytochrome P450 3A6 n=1 Tax=Parasteatoda tepidariorum TaxID=114398 RepID=UPI00077F9C25|nr:cytochrome P450 3A6 [Parasteatoda tepidariorum]
MVVMDITLNQYIGIFLGILIPYLLYRQSKKNHNYWKERNIPFVKPYPFIGSFDEAFRKSMDVLDIERHNKFGRIYGAFEGTKPILIVAEPELLRDIFTKDFHNFPARRIISAADPVLAKMLTVVQGEDWKRIRSIVSPTFSSGKLKRVFSIFQDCSKTLIQNFMKSYEHDISIDVLKNYGAFTMDVIASSAFSTKIDSHNDPDNVFVQNAKRVFSQPIGIKFFLFLIFPSVMKKLKAQLFPADVLDFFKSTTTDIIKERKKTGQTRNDFLQLLIDSADEISKEEKTDESTDDITQNYGEESSNHSVFKNVMAKHLSMDELTAQCLIFFLAGYHTTSVTLSFTSYLLALHQDIQEKLFQEISDILKKTKGQLTYEAVQEMKYLDNVISESLRLYPALVRLERTSAADVKLGDTGLIIPKGMLVGIPINAMHRDPTLFNNPEKFNPDRFSPEEREKIQPYSYLPFGAGPRNCVGMRFALLEIKVCLVYVVSTFHINISSETKVPLEFDKGQGLLRPKPINLKFLRRDNCILNNRVL